MQILEKIPVSLPPQARQLLQKGMVFLDIETTGLQVRTSHLYLIGVLFFDPIPHRFLLRQWFLNRPTEERNLLILFAEFLSSFHGLIHFNGNPFDLPYLRHKYEFYKLENPLDGVDSMDLARTIKPYARLLGLSSTKQKEWEKLISFSRDDLFSGEELISVYHEYLQSQDFSLREKLLLHNQEDILGMTAISSLLSIPQFFHGEFTVQECQYPPEALLILLECDSPLPVSLSVKTSSLFLDVTNQRADMTIYTKKTTLKHFFPDYQNYYYLPEEDQAIHKSVGIYVDPSHRQKAKASTCYQKKTGVFLPEEKPLFLPCFQETYHGVPSYFEWNNTRKENKELLHQYVVIELAALLKNTL